MKTQSSTALLTPDTTRRNGRLAGEAEGWRGEGNADPSSTQEDPPLRAVHTPNFPALLRQLGALLLVTTYQAGKLVLVRDEGDHLNAHFRAFQAPMGMAALQRIAPKWRGMGGDSRLLPSVRGVPGVQWGAAQNLATSAAMRCKAGHGC